MSKEDLRPPLWIGHVVLETDRLDETESFMRAIGMRPLMKQADVAVLELRGGTHLVLIAKPKAVTGEAPFDLMVEDIHTTHERFASLGFAPSPIETIQFHERFFVREPGGHTIAFMSNHVSGEPV